VVVERLAGFAAALRDRGVVTGPEDLIHSVETLDVLGIRSREDLYWGLRLAIVRRVKDLGLFDDVFAHYWGLAPDNPSAETRSGGDGSGTEEANSPREEASTASDPGGGAIDQQSGRLGASSGHHDDGEEPAGRGAYSDVEVLKQKSFADYSDADYERLQELVRELRFTGPWRESRRNRSARRGAIDIHRTVRAGFQTQGHPVRRRFRRRQLKRRNLTFVCDVSGSMQSYSQAVLQLAHAAVLAQRRVEAFAFATRLTRITPRLLDHDPEGALRSAVESVVDWSGGTRVGESLEELNRRYRTAIQGAVVVIASDGWDLGEPAQLEREAALLGRTAHRLVWVNPHLQDPAFEPLTLGMSTVLPYLDDFISCHNFESFAVLLELLAGA
jgi:hypothetical protein